MKYLGKPVRARSLLTRIAPLAVALSVLGSWGLVPASAQAASLTGTQQVGAASVLNNIACWDGQDCVAIGPSTDGTTGGVVPITNGAVSGDFQAITGLTVPNVAGIACYGSGSCLATGGDTGDDGASQFNQPDPDGLIPISGGVPGSPEAVSGMNPAAVACEPGSTDCIAVGTASGADGLADFVQITDGSIGTPVPIPGLDDGTFVACSAVGDCIVVGSDTNGDWAVVQITNGAVADLPQPLGPSSTNNQQVNGVACAGADNCFAFGTDNTPYQGVLVPITAGTPGTLEPVLTMGPITAMACAPNPGGCLAVGEDYATGDNAIVAISTTGDIGTEQVDSDPGLDTFFGFDGVACTTATDCVIVGRDSFTLRGAGVVDVLLSGTPGNPTATITTPAPATPPATFEMNDQSHAKFVFGCQAAFGGAPLSSCTGSVSNGTTSTLVTSGELIDTSTVGSFTLTVTATASDDSPSSPDSATATSSYTVHTPAPPACTSQTVDVANEGSVPITLACQVNPADPNQSDPVGDYAVGTQPTHGTLTLTHGATVTYTYTPTGDYTGTDSFTFHAFDNEGSSPPATVTINVGAPPVPACTDQNVNVTNQTSKAIALGCADDPSDPGDALTYAVVSQPTHGTLNGLNTATGAVTYAPTGTYTGPDSFTFDATDGKGLSNVSTVSLTVAPPTPPTCVNQSLNVANATATQVALGCTDANADNGDPLTFTILTQPTNGTLTGLDATRGTVTYTPNGIYAGPDSFTFEASDTQGTSVSGTASITVAQQIAPADTGLPAVSGSAQLGQTMTCSPGTWSGGVPQTYAYQWLRDGGAIPGATGATYVVAAADQGHALSCAVTATNAGGSSSATSPGAGIPTPPPPPPAATAPANTGAPGVSGAAALKQVLTCATGAWSGTAPLTYSYQWNRGGEAIAGAIAVTYMVGTADVGHELTCAVTARNTVGSATAQSAAVAIAFPSSVFTFSRPTASKTGLIAIKLEAPGPGEFSAVATFPTPKSTTAKQASVAKSKSKTTSYGRRSGAVTKKGAITLTIHPTSAAVSLVKKHGSLRVSVAVTFTPTAGKPRTTTSSLTVKHA